MTGPVLLVEDDDSIARLVTAVLTRGGFAVSHADAGRQGLRQASELHPAAVVLDVGLPDLDGWEVLDRLRDISDVPVLMLTARGDSTDKVRGLRGGADDYLTKPFDNGELLARVEALIRRGRPSAAATAAILTDGRLCIDPASTSITLSGEEIAVTPIEFRLLTALLRHQGQVLSLGQLLELAWGDSSGISPEKVRFAIHRLRKKLGWESDDSPIEAVRGFGYRYRRTVAG